MSDFVLAGETCTTWRHQANESHLHQRGQHLHYRLYQDEPEGAWPLGPSKRTPATEITLCLDRFPIESVYFNTGYIWISELYCHLLNCKMHVIVEGRLLPKLNTRSGNVSEKGLGSSTRCNRLLLAPCYTLLPSVKVISLIDFMQSCLKSDKKQGQSNSLAKVNNIK